jgi:CRISPR-associated protein Csh1
MLDTLYQLGQHLSKDSSRLEFDDCIAAPPVDEKETAKGLEFLVAEVIFDLDAGTFRLSDEPRAFDELDKTARWSPYSLRCVKIQGGNNKSVYPTADPRKSFDPWKKTFFGKEDKNGNPPKKAELAEAIEKDFPDLAETPVCHAAISIFKMREAFEAAFPEWKKVTEALKWGEKSRVVMLFASVVSTEFGCPEPVPVAKLDGFDRFLRRKFLQKTSGEEISVESKTRVPKTCYVTGAQGADVGEPVFGSRYSLNKMFVTTTKNYASGFDDKAFPQNYQASGNAQTFLERGSKYVLENLKVQIAGIDHCILPQFRSGQDIDLEGQVPRLKSKSELLFLMAKKEFRNVTKDVRTAADDEIYWLTFLGYESDGNFFKTINLIKDISKTHFETVIRVLRDVDDEMAEMLGEQWEKTMTFTKDKEKIRADFNFLTVFNFTPVRKEKDKRNAALALFKAILERRLVSPESIFQHFAELIQLHRFGRGGYNILPMSKDYFDVAARNAVFQYHAFLYFLKKIRLLDMEETMNPSTATLEEKNAAISAFFERMGYSDDQRAMFYLGRVLGNVGRAQHDKGHKTKPVLQKVNYNGMDAASLKRLHADLFEKSKQYEIFKYTDGFFSKFTDLFKDFPENRWDKRMKPEESLFYLLSGYSFRTPKEADEDPGTEPTTEL